MRRVYVAIAPDGSIIGTQDDRDEAIAMARHADPHQMIAVESLPPDMQANPDDDEPSEVEPSVMSQDAFDKLGLSRLDEEECMRVEPEDAHAALLPYFEGLTRTSEEITVKKYDEWDGMVDAWIATNFKMAKGDVRHKAAEVMGLVLVPADHPYNAAHNEGSYGKLTRSEWPGIDQLRRRWAKEFGDSTFSTWCGGSNKQCRETCLVFTGQNASERYNTARKIAQSMALLKEPVAFMRVLVESIERWLNECSFRHAEVDPFFRCNVLSDIPWELLAPWLFRRFAKPNGDRPALSFYDYTKVSGRRVGRGTNIPNYDLTFSFSGSNFRQLTHDFAEYGRRFSVVLVGAKPVGVRKPQWKTIGVKGKKAIEAIPLPETFWGCRVVDGDVSDVRPRDDDRTCVALRYKIPSKKLSGADVDPLSARMTFVTPVYLVPGEEVQYFSERIAKLAGGSPAKRMDRAPTDDWLMAAHTPRNQPIEQHLATLV